MRVVLDTNIVVSALVWGGVPYRLLQLCQAGEIEIVTSPVLIAELADVLARPQFAPRIAAQDTSAIALVTQYQSFVQSVSPQSVPAVIAADPDDDHVLACAVAGHADLIVSSDKHLHSLGGQYNGIPIVKASEAVRIIEAG
ncbi:MAG: putative toxin-antitoxin system toxin component, PIN family [Burkholderiales bacterium]